MADYLEGIKKKPARFRGNPPFKKPRCPPRQCDQWSSAFEVNSALLSTVVERENQPGRARRGRFILDAELRGNFRMT